MTATLCRRPASSIPVPRPVTASAAAPVKTAERALAAVVLPMPISPTPSRSSPAGSARIPATRLAAGRERGECLDARHRGLDRHVGGAVANPGGDQSAATDRVDRDRRDRPRDADVEDHDPCPHRGGQHVDRRSTGDEVGDHLGSDLGRVGRDALRRDPVVAGRDDDRPGRDRRVGTSGDPGQLDDEPFEPAEASGGFVSRSRCASASAMAARSSGGSVSRSAFRRASIVVSVVVIASHPA